MYDGGIQRVAVVQPTGSGKSLLMAKLIEDNPNSRFFVLSTSHKINNQFKAKLDEEALKRIGFNIYCNMPNMKEETMESLQPDYIVLDEMHRALAKEWSKGIKVLLEMYPNAKVLGLSATPIRYLDRCRNVVDELFGGKLACDMSLSQAILDGILPMARYVCGIYSFQKDAESLNKKIGKSCNSEEEKKELLKELKVLKQNLDKGHGVSDIFKKYVVGGNEKFVVFLKNTTHLREMKPVIEKWFLDAGFTVRVYEVHSKNADKDKEFQKFTEDKGEGIKLCLSVAMLCEGIHGDIDGVIMLRDTVSPNMYFQMIGRAFACGKKTIPLIFDLVANSQFISGAVDNFPNEIRGEIEKRKKECEKEGKGYEVGFDVDEFIVMDYFMDVVSGFKEIERRLIGSWDAMFQEYCKFYEENGHGDVPKTEEYRKLHNWCAQNRINRIQNSLSEEKILMLNNGKFIWNINKYRLTEKAHQVIEFYKVNGRFPYCGEKWVDGTDIGDFLARIRNERRRYKGTGKCVDYKKDIFDLLDSYSIVWEPSDVAFEKFYYYLCKYKEEFGNVNAITSTEVYKSYPLGNKCSQYRSKFNKNKLAKGQIEKLSFLGFDFLYKSDSERAYKYSLVGECIKRNIIISNKNRKYNDVDLYEWIKTTETIKYKKGEMTKEQEKKIEKVLGYSISVFGNRKKIRKIQAFKNGKLLGVYNSSCDLSRNSLNDFGVFLSGSSVRYVCDGKYKQYKGFTFQYSK